MRHAAIILSGLLLTTACGPATEEVTAVAEASGATAPDVAPDAPAHAPEPLEVFPVPAGTACDIRGGWSEDLDPAGLNVRAGPSANAAIVGKLPRSKFIKDQDRMVPTTFDIVEVRDGWVRIANAIAPEDYFGEYDKAPRLASGWISGRHVGFELQTDKAFAEPDPGSPVIATSWNAPDGSGHPMLYRNLLDCRGAWVKMVFTDHQSKDREGWARGVCSTVETSCDGANGDNFGPGEKKPSGPAYRRKPSIWDEPRP